MLTNVLQMGPPPNPEAMLEMMENPMFLSQMNEAMNNPAVVDMMMQNPMVRTLSSQPGNHSV